MLFRSVCAGGPGAAGAMADASTDLDNAETQRQLNNNNRPASSTHWDTECTSSKLFECSRIKALAGQDQVEGEGVGNEERTRGEERKGKARGER